MAQWDSTIQQLLLEISVTGQFSVARCASVWLNSDAVECRLDSGDDEATF